MQTYKLLEDDGVLLAQPHLIKQLGRTGATFLNQIHYWLTHEQLGVMHEGKRWIYNTAKEWGQQICLSERQIHHYLKKFSDMGFLIIKKLNQKRYDRTNYITLNYDVLDQLYHSQMKVQQHPAVSSESKMMKSQNLYTKITNKEINNQSNIQNHVVDSHQQVEQVDSLNLQNERVEKNTPSCATKKTTIAQDMLHIWHKMFPNKTAVMDKILAKQLVAAFNHKCQKNLDHWQNYLERMQTSSFIMSNQFNLTLDWALKFKTIDRIFNGDLGVKKIPVKVDEKKQEEEAKTHIQRVDESPSCQQIRSILLQSIGSVKYNAWFTKVKFVERGGEIQMKAENQFVEDYIKQHFGQFLNI